MKNRMRLVAVCMPLLALALLPGACASKDGGGGKGGSAGDGAGGGGEAGKGGGGSGEGGVGGGGGSGGTVGSGGTTATGGATTGGTGNGGTGGTGTGGTGTGGAGTGGTGTGGAGTGGTGAGGTGGAIAAKRAVATIAGIEGGTITGTVSFTQTGTSVSVTYALANCPAGQHGTHIHGGTGCDDRQQQGMHWDGKRGEGIGTGTITCGADMKGTLTYTRAAADPATKWSIGDGSATDIIGHPLIVHGLTDSDRHGCGVITKSP